MLNIEEEFRITKEYESFKGFWEGVELAKETGSRYKEGQTKDLAAINEIKKYILHVN